MDLYEKICKALNAYEDKLKKPKKDAIVLVSSSRVHELHGHLHISHVVQNLKSLWLYYDKDLVRIIPCLDSYLEEHGDVIVTSELIKEMVDHQDRGFRI